MKPYRLRWVGCAVAAFLWPCAWPGNAFGDNAMTSTKIEYMISEMMGPPELLVIEADGSARFESHTNRAVAGAAAVGTFATTLTAGQMATLAAAFSNPPFRSLVDHWGEISSGERYKAI